MKLTEILSPQSIRVPLTATTKDEAIAELVDLLAATGRLADRQKVLSAVLEREHTRSTGIGSGLAIPHGKSSGVAQLVMALGKPKDPIDYDSVDGKPVNLLILLASPLDQTGPHIQALAHISRLMSLDPFRRKLSAAATADDVWRVIQDQEAAE